MKTAICIVLSTLLIPVVAFGGGGKDYEEVVMVPQDFGMEYSYIDEPLYMNMILMFSDELELSDEQKQQIIDMEVEQRDALEGLELQIEEIDLDIRKKLHKGAPLEEIKPMMTEKYALYAEEEWLDMLQWDAKMEVLNEDQRKKWKLLERDFSFMPMETMDLDEF